MTSITFFLEFEKHTKGKEVMGNQRESDVIPELNKLIPGDYLEGKVSKSANDLAKYIRNEFVEVCNSNHYLNFHCSIFALFCCRCLVMSYFVLQTALDVVALYNVQCQQKEAAMRELESQTVTIGDLKVQLESKEKIIQDLKGKLESQTVTIRDLKSELESKASLVLFLQKELELAKEKLKPAEDKSVSNPNS